MASRPSKGPMLSQGNSADRATVAESDVKSSMLTIEIPKPMQLVNVKTLPTA